MIRRAAAGDASARDDFAQAYLRPVHSYLEARWRGMSLTSSVGDAVQEVFVDCFRADGALSRVDDTRSFRAFLLGVSQKIAMRFEERAARERAIQDQPTESPVEPGSRELGLSSLFDREWARSVMRRAADLQRAQARAGGAAHHRRVEILRLHFEQGLSIPEIAATWNEDPARIHHEYASARADFRRALLEVIGLHDGSPAHEIDAEAERLINLISKPPPD